MSARGRKRKPGARTKSGRLSRAGKLRYDPGTERAQAMQALYGPNGCDAIGRAFTWKLLGEADEAKPKLDAARKLAAIYWRAYTVGGFKSCLDNLYKIDEETGQRQRDFEAEAERNERIKKDEAWLRETTRAINKMGQNVRQSFDQLVLNLNADEGPPWLDRLIKAKATALFESKRRSAVVPPQFDERDMAKLREALDGLEALF